MNIKKRIASIDILRGFVIILMLLDHVRERFFLYQQVSDPMDVEQISTGLYATRYLAHFCAPIFVFLTGLSAWLYANPSNRPKRSASSFLFKRGLFLVALEILLINFLWFGTYKTLYLQVIWAIGLCMISLSLLCKLPRIWVGILGFIIVFGHNLLTSISFLPEQMGYSLWTILHDRGFLASDSFINIKVSYPLLPWIGVICLGYFSGKLFSSTTVAKIRQNWLISLGLSCWVLLFCLRISNFYGETLPWQNYDSVSQTLMSFFNFTKYPPSLDFLLITLGLGLFLLYFFERYESKVTDILKIFGSVPMFFYVLHLFVLLVLHQVAIWIFGANQGEHFGVSHLWQIWFIWAVLVVLLYAPTAWFSRYKRQSNSVWISYF